MKVLSYQDFFKVQGDITGKISKAIDDHKATTEYQTARTADLYDHHRNKTINDFTAKVWDAFGRSAKDFTAANNKIARNYFRRLNTQRCAYLLGNGVTFANTTEEVDAEGIKRVIDTTKDTLGNRFDTAVYKVGYYALIHGMSFGFWNVDHLRLYKLTEFVPLFDEENGGLLKAGIYFKQTDAKSPLFVIFYEEDGFTKLRSDDGSTINLKVVKPKRKYKVQYQKSEADEEAEMVSETNYDSLPIKVCYGSELKQSTLIGMQQTIDALDLIISGFANDLQDCVQIYWLMENYGGMNEEDLTKFRDTLKTLHIAQVDTTEGGRVQPYTQDIPFQARTQAIAELRSALYEDFGGLDVHTIAAGSTNDHIEAAYQPMDEEADDFEYQIIDFITQILSLIGIDDSPVFKRNRISNQREMVEMILMESQYLDKKTIISSFPNISPDQVEEILMRKEAEDMQMMELQTQMMQQKTVIEEEQEE